jgi:hypothetical protein
MKIPASRTEAGALDLSLVTGGGLGEFVDDVKRDVKDVAHTVWYGRDYQNNPRYLNDPEHAAERRSSERRPTERQGA